MDTDCSPCVTCLAIGNGLDGHDGRADGGTCSNLAAAAAAAAGGGFNATIFILLSTQLPEQNAFATLRRRCTRREGAYLYYFVVFRAIYLIV